MDSLASDFEVRRKIPPKEVTVVQRFDTTQYKVLTDKRDGSKYKTIEIGSQEWMAENLRYKPKEGKSWCYDNKDINCKKYGRLYDWNSIDHACPSGWHIPSKAEWDELIEYVVERKSSEYIAHHFKSNKLWDDSENTDEYGFNALPVGLRLNGSFTHFKKATNFWTGSSIYGQIVTRSLTSESGLFHWGSNSSESGLSLRCIRTKESE